MGRLIQLDIIRGVSAFLIMLYHYMVWLFEPMESDTFLGRVGIFGVSIFFLLSGATLYIIYNSKILNVNSIGSFYVRRFFRIYPLMWVVLTISLVLSKKSISVQGVFMNYSGLFGFFSWDKGLATGIWSIGNELVYYTAFPMILLMMRKLSPVAVLLIFLSIDIYFQLTHFNTLKTLSEQGNVYFSPLNSLFLFVLGCFIGYVYELRLNPKNWVVILLFVLSIIGFVFLPVYGDRINLITQLNRYIFYAVCGLIVLSLIHMNMGKSKLLIPFQILGESSYSLYLLHPLVFTVINFGIASKFNLNSNLVLLASVLLSVFVSIFIYRYFEKFFIHLGKSDYLGRYK